MAPRKETVLKVTSMRYKKPGVTDQRFHDYGTHEHAAKAAIIQKRHGALRIAQYHTPPVMRELLKEKLPWVIANGWKIEDHDAQIQLYVRSLDQVTAIVMDPDFQALISGENDVQEEEGTTVACGWEEVYVDNNEIVNVDADGKVLYGTWEERSATGQSVPETIAESK